jgi:acyl-CoA synthetase (AMP-forming)/AMP-acid ligase II
MPLKCRSQLRPKGQVVPIITLTSTTTTFMSRRARHLAADAKASARQQGDLLYSHNPQYVSFLLWCTLMAIISILLNSGKVVCSTSRLLKRHRKVAQIPPTNSLNHISGLPRLGPELVALNNSSFPVTLSVSPGSIYHIPPDG